MCDTSLLNIIVILYISHACEIISNNDDDDEGKKDCVGMMTEHSRDYGEFQSFKLTVNVMMTDTHSMTVLMLLEDTSDDNDEGYDDDRWH